MNGLLFVFDPGELHEDVARSRTGHLGLGYAELVDTLGRDPAVRAILLSGQGKHFTAGLDLGYRRGNWDLSGTFFGSFGNEIFEEQKEFYVFRNFSTNVREDLLTDSWTPENPDAKYPRLDVNDTLLSGRLGARRHLDHHHPHPNATCEMLPDLERMPPTRNPRPTQVGFGPVSRVAQKPKSLARKRSGPTTT